MGSNPAQPTSTLSYPCFPWPRDTGVTTTLVSCSAPPLCPPGPWFPALRVKRSSYCVLGQACCEAEEGSLLLRVCPELAVSYVPSARCLARFALSSTLSPNWKCMLLYNPFYWHLLSLWSSRIVIIYSVLLLHNKMDFHFPLIFFLSCF